MTSSRDSSREGLTVTLGIGSAVMISTIALGGTRYPPDDGADVWPNVTDPARMAAKLTDRMLLMVISSESVRCYARMIAVLSVLLLVVSLPLAIEQRITVEPFFPVSVWYPASTDIDTLRRDFLTIRGAGFNSVTTWISWMDGEPRRGAFNLLPVDRILAVASETDLKVQIHVHPSPEPSWKSGVPDARAGEFYEYVRRRIGSHPALIRVEYSAADTIARRAIVGDGAEAMTLPKARRAMWSAIAAGAREFGFMDRQQPAGASVLALGTTASVITRNAPLFAPLEPRKIAAGEVTVDPGGRVSVSLLESTDAIVLIAVNHTSEIQKTAISLAPVFPEAVWQDMEEGRAVQFVTTEKGPSFTHTFVPDDVLVLAIGKKRRVP